MYEIILLNSGIKYILSKLMKIIIMVFAICVSAGAMAQTTSSEAQIKSAVLAAPEEMRSTATVMGYNSDNQLILLREGSGDLICLADNPDSKGFNVACYQKDLDPFMVRGRELRAEGKKRQEVFEIRGEEVKAGKLEIPKGSTLHILYGPDDVLNKETGEVTGANLRYVVYMPYASSESTGLPLKPSSPGAPWLMDPGTHRAHIMITPLSN